MKPLPLLTLSLLFSLSLSACSSEPTPPPAPTTPEPAAMEQSKPIEESNDILDLKMENALEELNMVE